jgi:hypothetical protein
VDGPALYFYIHLLALSGKVLTNNVTAHLKFMFVKMNNVNPINIAIAPLQWVSMLRHVVLQF